MKLFNLFKFVTLSGVIAGLSLTSCNKDRLEGVPPKDPDVVVNVGTKIKTTVFGKVTDTNGNPITDADVLAHGKTTITDDNGIFFIENIDVPKEACYVKVTKAGYFTGSRATYPIEDNVTSVSITMLDNIPTHSMNSSTGGIATDAAGNSVELPANSVVDVNGGTYNGTINLSLKYLNPSDANFTTMIPGDYRAINSNQEEVALYSYSMMNVELTGASGQPLQIADGQQATVTMKIDPNKIGSASNTIPLWYFDEINGIWVEDGEATLQGDSYVGTVTHFTTWNCDWQGPRGCVHGTVVDCNGKPVSGIKVDIDGAFSVVTDENGEYHHWVAADPGITITITIAASSNYGLTADPITVGPLTADEDLQIPAIQLLTCPAYIEGDLTNCESESVGGVVYASWNGAESIVYTENGHFSLTGPENELVTIYAYTIDLTSGQLQVQFPNGGNINDMGNITVCTDYESTNSYEIDGNLVIFDLNTSTSSIRYYTGQDKTYGSINSFDAGFSVNFPGNSTGTFVEGTDNIYFTCYSPGLPGDSLWPETGFVIDVTKYEAVGGFIEGEFYGSMISVITGDTYQITNGRFSLIRLSDI